MSELNEQSTVELPALGSTVTCYEADGTTCTGTLTDVRTEQSGRQTLTLWTGNVHRFFHIERLAAPGTKTRARKATAATTAPVDVHDYVRGENKRCASCGGARNIKAHTHIATKGESK